MLVEQVWKLLIFMAGMEAKEAVEKMRSKVRDKS